jgi:hypothetical protein
VSRVFPRSIAAAERVAAAEKHGDAHARFARLKKATEAAAGARHAAAAFAVDAWTRPLVFSIVAAALYFTVVSGAFYTLVPIRPRSRGERRSLRTFAIVSLRPGSLAFTPRPRRLSTPLLTPFNSTPTFARMERPSVCGGFGLHGMSNLTGLSAGQQLLRLPRSVIVAWYGAVVLAAALVASLRRKDGAAVASVRRELEKREREYIEGLHRGNFSCRWRADAYVAPQVRSTIQKSFTQRSVSALDRIPFQLTGELFLYGMALLSGAAKRPTQQRDRVAVRRG